MNVSRPSSFATANAPDASLGSSEESEFCQSANRGAPLLLGQSEKKVVTSCVGFLRIAKIANHTFRKPIE